ASPRLDLRSAVTCGSFLALRAEVRRSLGLHDAADDAAVAVGAALAGAAVDQEGVGGARLLDVADVGAVALDALLLEAGEGEADGGQDRAGQTGHLGAPERRGGAARVDARPKAGLVRLDVTHAGEEALVEERDLDRGAQARQALGEAARIDAVAQ